MVGGFDWVRFLCFTRIEISIIIMFFFSGVSLKNAKSNFVIIDDQNRFSRAYITKIILCVYSVPSRLPNFSPVTHHTVPSRS